MARDWTDTEQVQDDIFTRMAGYGENTAEIPYSIFQERREDGLWWVVQIHVRVPGITDFDMEGEGKTVDSALRCLYLGLNNQDRTLNQAKQSNLIFGVAV